MLRRGLCVPVLRISRICHFVWSSLVWEHPQYSALLISHDGGRQVRGSSWRERACGSETSGSQSDRREDRGCGAAETHVGQPPGVHPGIGGLRGGTGQRVEVSLPLLQQRRRWDSQAAPPTHMAPTWGDSAAVLRMWSDEGAAVVA